MRAIQALPLLLLLLGSASCRGAQATDDPSRPPPPKTTVEVRNLQQVDFNLYVLTGTHRLRLGTVPAMTTRRFVIPPHLVGEQELLRFGFDVIGSDQRGVSEQSVPVHAGARLSLTLQ